MSIIVNNVVETNSRVLKTINSTLVKYNSTPIITIKFNVIK